MLGRTAGDGIGGGGGGRGLGVDRLEQPSANDTKVNKNENQSELTYVQISY